MKYVKAGEEHIGLLVKMNRHLIQDERSSNPMSDRQLRHRMVNFLQSNFEAYLGFEEERPVGYVLYRFEVEYVYVRHFFISRDFRRQGYGEAFMQWLSENPWRAYRRVALDVLAHNKSGREFWRAVGFQEQYVHMVWEK